MVGGDEPSVNYRVAARAAVRAGARDVIEVLRGLRMLRWPVDAALWRDGDELTLSDAGMAE